MEGNFADDGVNLKYVPNVVINETLFKDNYADQIDLDYTNAFECSVFEYKRWGLEWR